MRLADAHSHALVEAVPLDADSFARAPMYFKAEVDSAAGEWSQHHAKRMIDTRDKVRPAQAARRESVASTLAEHIVDERGRMRQRRPLRR